MQAPFAVGLTSLSSEDMYMSGGRGKCVEIFHVIGDSLCQLSDKPLMRPELGIARNSLETSTDSITEELDDETLDGQVADSIKNSEKRLDSEDSLMRLSTNVDNIQIERRDSLLEVKVLYI